MNEAELKACTASLDNTKLDSCIKTSGMLLALEMQDAIKLTEMTVPTAVIDCKYRGHSAYVADALCYYYPNTRGC
jgi:pyrimidine operon attenuation protein/uracil phosphoribosyltransferase